MIPTYAGFRKQIPLSAFTVADIPGTAIEQARNIRIQYVNRAGRNLLSESKYAYGSGVSVTINSGAILAHEEVFWIIVSCESTSNQQDAAILAQIQTRNSDQTTPRSLPITLQFTTDEHFEQRRIVQSLTDLPTSGMLSGAIAYVLDTALYYRYDHEATVNIDLTSTSYGVRFPAYGKWIEWNGNFNAYIASTTDDYGCDRPLNLVDSPLKLPQLVGFSSGGVEYWLNNGLSDDGGSLIEGARYSFAVSVNGVPGYESIFANKISYTVLIMVNRADMSPTLAGGGASYSGLWNPSDGLINLDFTVPRGFAVVVIVFFVFDKFDLLGKLPGQSSSISLDFVEVLNIQGRVSDIAKIVGNMIFNELEKLAIALPLKRLSGSASIKDGYMINQSSSQDITGLIEDESGQKVILCGNLNGYAKVKPSSYTLGYSEVLRAVVSTESGLTRLLQVGTVNLTNKKLRVTIFHPRIDQTLNGLVRSDYPDELIADSATSRFTPLLCRILIDKNGSKFTSQDLAVSTTASNATQVFVLNQSDFTAIANLPSEPDSYFGLFEPTGGSVAAQSGTGNITGSITVYFAYYYKSPNYLVTKIDHDPDGVIPTFEQSLSEIVTNGLNSSTPIIQYVAASTSILASATNLVHYIVDTTAAPVLISLPIFPDDKSAVRISDRSRNFATNNVTINTTGSASVLHKIDTQIGVPYVLDQDGMSVTLIFDLGRTNWIVLRD